ncbi:Crp/Fnr family transcriptional regulator [Haliscomenobacter hydrossis]|nr:Crp/Fnr family transcriptional regulator [Haliscomenobacter hydrossis]
MQSTAMIDQNLRIARVTQPYLFQNSFILTDLPVKELLILQENAKPESRKRGDVLFRQGGYPKGAFWLLSGKAKIFQETPDGQRQTHYIYSNGDLIAYRQLIADEVHPVSATLLEDATVGFISTEIFRGLLNTSPFFARNILTALAREFTVWMNRMTVFTQFPVRSRLVLALLILHEQYRLSGSPAGVITMTRSELAEYVGASLETVVRVFNDLKNNKLVQVHGRRILLPNPNGLLDILQKEEG